MPVLDFPSRYSLLAQSWRFEHASGAIATALNISADRLTKMVKGDTKNLTKQGSLLALTQKLAGHLESQGVLRQKGVDRATFIAKFATSNDLEFVEFIAAKRHVPVPPSVLAVPRRNAQNLLRRLGGVCLLYRLGTDERVELVSGGRRLITELPVLRRIPAVIADSEEGYLHYKDSYGWYGNTFEIASATGYIFLIKDHFTILAEDTEGGGISELFLVELDQHPIRMPDDAAGILYKGVIVMKGDTGVPTACKVLLRRAPEEFQAQLQQADNADNEAQWQTLARALERRIYLEDNDKDGRFEFAAHQDPASAVERSDLEPFSNLRYSWYADQLQIREFKVDIR